ncbi:trypco2 family protein [Streptomyces sp. GTA36]
MPAKSHSSCGCILTVRRIIIPGHFSGQESLRCPPDVVSAHQGDPLMPQEPWAGLSEAISAIRAELEQAMSDGDGHKIQFRTGPVEMEFAVDVSRRTPRPGRRCPSCRGVRAPRRRPVTRPAPHPA